MYEHECMRFDIESTCESGLSIRTRCKDMTELDPESLFYPKVRLP